MDILYFDNHLLVVNKPAGLATEAETGMSLEVLVREFVKKTYQKQGEAFVRAVHRLDKPASGLVLLAKTSKALTRLQEAFRKRLIQKTYLARIEGIMPSQEGFFEDYMVHGLHRAHIASAKDPQARYAALSFTCRSPSLLEIILHTGRYHQIRAQLASRGYPIINDHKYGAKKHEEIPGIALHHWQMSFVHPVTKEPMHFCVEPPQGWRLFQEER
ncbi:MAG: RluA family pseudouridine synthase [Chlamydiae bacterium]|nr:RluA family pseudouridine synthase [Chlamydiota bacterium]